MENFLGILAALGTALSKSATDITSKIALRGIDEVRTMAIQWSTGAIILLVINVLCYPSLLTAPTSTMTELTSSSVWWILALNGTLNAAAFYFYLRAFKLSDASLVAPMMLFTPIVLLFTSPLMLGESIPALGVVGVLVTVGGSYFMGASLEHDGRFGVFVALFKDRGVRSMLITSLLWGVTSNLDKMGVQASSPVLWSGMVSIVIALYSVGFWVAFRQKGAASGWPAIIPGATNAVGTLLQMQAITLLYVPYVIAIKRVSAVITVLIGRVALGEKTAGRLTGSVVMAAGIALIAFAN